MATGFDKTETFYQNQLDVTLLSYNKYKVTKNRTVESRTGTGQRSQGLHDNGASVDMYYRYRRVIEIREVKTRNCNNTMHTQYLEPH